MPTRGARWVLVAAIVGDRECVVGPPPNANVRHRFVFSFDLTGIPRDANVRSATLTIWQESVTAPGFITDDADADSTCSSVGLNDGEDHAATGHVLTLLIGYTRPIL